MSGAQGRLAHGVGRPRKSKRRALPLVAAITLAIAMITGFSMTAFGGNILATAADAAVSQAKSFVDLIKQRSPGQRIKGILTKTKMAHKAAKPHQRALPKVRMAMPAVLPFTAPPTAFDFLAPPIPMKAASFETIPGLPLQSSPPGIPFFPPGLIVPPGGTSTPGPPPPGGTPPPVVNPPPPSVPEPATWLSMLLGFLLIGVSMRRRRKPKVLATG